MFDDIVVRGLNFRSPGLSSREHFGGLEVLEVRVVALDQDLVIGALVVVSPLFHCLDNRQELLIIRVVVLFGRRVFSGVEID